jgi:hypothetical protein
MKAASDPAGTTPLIQESAQPPKAARPERDGENAASPVRAATPKSIVNESIADEQPASPVVSPEPEHISLPAQIAREQITSGKALGPPIDPASRKRSQRVAAAARDVVEERLAPRVEKIRQASNVVWGEAQDDPNLRFILIAVFLFIVALVIILLGTYMR